MRVRLQIIELILIFIIAVVTLLTEPPLPLLAIPFLIIILMRTIFEVDGSRRALVRSNKQLAEMDKMKTLFLASMTHMKIATTRLKKKREKSGINEKRKSVLLNLLDWRAM